jgi:vacuolar-type H+-ATPase subunit F/Vma7
MATCVFIGDELSAAGYRLAGVECLAPSLTEIEQMLRAPDPDLGLLMMTAEQAERLPAALFTRARRRQRPALILVPDIRGQHPPADLTASLKRQLGLAE